MGIEPGRDEDHLRLELVERGEDPLLELFQILSIVRSRAQGNIERKASAVAGADSVAVACAGVVRVLMEADIEHPRIIEEDTLRAVPMVDIPVDDGDPVEPRLAGQPSSRDRDIVEEAESHRPAPLCVMSRRPDGAEGVRDPSLEDISGGMHTCSGGMQRRARRVGCGYRVALVKDDRLVDLE